MTSHLEDRLYYRDATLREFRAEISATELSATEIAATEIAATEIAATPAVAVKAWTGDVPVRVQLSQTAFYPTSGGQPHDTGTLNGVPVVEVVEDDEGAIWHVLAQPLACDTVHVLGVIDWSRRFDHMQQHTGQHLLSAALEDLISASTVGFHLGSEVSTVDLALSPGSSLDWDAVFGVERAVNQVIWENRPVTVRIVSEDEVAEIRLRKPPAVTGKIRVVEVAGYDASACGGTHVAATGEIGIVKVIGLERYKGGVRVTFLAGGRALQHYQKYLSLLHASSLALSVGPEELPQAISRIEESARDARHDLRQIREELLTYEAGRLWSEAAVVDNTRVIAASLIARTFAEARSLAGGLRERPATFILFAVAEDNATRLVCARSDDLAQLDAATVLRDLLGTLGGRGGGSATMAQGGAPAHPPERIMCALQDTLRRYNLA